MHSNEAIVAASDLTPQQLRVLRETLREIVESTHFRRSKRYPAFLEFVVSYTLSGNTNPLKERVVAEEVFGRTDDYDPSTDPIVRYTAGEVRKRMAAYYSEHPESPLRIELPLGQYSAEFHFRAQPAVEEAKPHDGSSTVDNDPKPARKWRSRWLWAVPIAAILLPLAIWYATQSNPDLPVKKFWAPLVDSHSPVLISVGAPFDPAPPKWETGLPGNSLIDFMHRSPNSPVPDISAANSINQYLIGRGVTSDIRMAGAMQFSDLLRSPAVLVGSGPVSPWATRLGSGLRYQFTDAEGGAVHLVADRNHPTNSDWKVDLRLPYDQIGADYAIITRELNSSTGQWWIGFGGVTSLSTEGAARLLLDRAAMKEIESKLPSGWERKNLQVVVKFAFVNGTEGTMQVVASNVW